MVSVRVMVLNVLYFAHVREVTGRSSERVEVPKGANVAQVVAHLVTLHPGIERLLPTVRFAVDGEFVGRDAPVPAGAEFVLIPPVAGGSDPATTVPEDGPDNVIGVVERPLTDVDRARIERYVGADSHGGIATFTGVVRDHARGRAVTRLYYEAYQTMAVRKLAEVAREVEHKVPGSRVAVLHRVGMLEIGDAAVICAAGSAHRAEAFEACRMLIDRLKQEVPIWKREVGPDGEEWVSDRP